MWYPPMYPVVKVGSNLRCTKRGKTAFKDAVFGGGHYLTPSTVGIFH